MLHLLEGLKEEFQKKYIYIWNINQSSAILFLDLSFHDIETYGFVVSDEEAARYGNNIQLFNRPILSVTEFLQQHDVVLVTLDNVSTIYSAQLPPQVKWYRRKEILGFASGIKGKKIYVYGTGSNANQMSEKMIEAGVVIKGYCTSIEPQFHDFRNCEVRKYNKKDYVSDDIMVISVLRQDFKNEILDTLQDFPGDVYVESIVTEDWKANTVMHRVLWKAMQEKRKIILCSKPDLYIDLFKKICKKYDIQLKKQIYLEDSKEKNIGDLYSLALENIDNVSVVVNERNSARLYEIVMALRQMGFTADIPNVDGLQQCMDGEKFMCGKNRYVLDALLDCVIEFDQGKSRVWKIWKTKGHSELTILILGGSTSTAELYYPEDWTEKLFKKLVRAGIKATIYVGAAPGRHVVFEFLALLRDGVALRPDIVISMSGCNNTYSSDVFLNQFNLSNVYSMENVQHLNTGIPVKESPYEFWLRVEKMMKLYSEEIGASFFCFLQPINLFMEDMSFEEKLQFEMENHVDGAKDFYEKAVKNEIYINLYSLFHHKKGMIFDSCHYTDAGGECLAEEVLKVISPIIAKRR